LSHILNAEARVRDVVVFGASAGGVQAMMALLPCLPADLPAVLALVLHRPPTPSPLTSLLSRSADLRVIEASDRRPIRRGHLYVAPPDRHLIFTPEGLGATDDPKQHSTRPAVDPLFLSAAERYGPRVIGVVLSGCGTDGAIGLAGIRRAGGVSVVQDPDEAMHPYMPMAAIADRRQDAVLRLAEIGDAIDKLTRGQPFRAGARAGTWARRAE
jgi:two-component system chemotaxis response regulator CheB